MATLGIERAPSRKAKTKEDWEHCFYDMEERCLQLQKCLNEKEKELKLAKVKSVKESLPSGRRKGKLSTESTLVKKLQGHLDSKSTLLGSHKTVKTLKDPTVTCAQWLDESEGSVFHSILGESEAEKHNPSPFPFDETTSYMTYPTLETLNPQTAMALQEVIPPGLENNEPDAFTNVVRESVKKYTAENPSHPYATLPRLPDSSDMLSLCWGGPMGNNNAQMDYLSTINTKLRATVDENEESIRNMQRDLSNLRKLTANLQHQLGNSRGEAYQLVRERDLAAQKLTNANNSLQQQQMILQTTADDREKIRFSLDSEIRELRNRLMSANDSNDAVTTDVRTLMSDLKERNAKLCALQSKHIILETSYESQKSANETLVAELESMNKQLANERRNNLSTTRELQALNATKTKAIELERRVQQIVEEKQHLEKEQVKMLDSMVNITRMADETARGQVQQELHEVAESAHHWERVSKLLYKDAIQRNTAYSNMRNELFECKKHRDELELALRAVKQEVQFANNKLDVIWPHHQQDCIPAGARDEGGIINTRKDPKWLAARIAQMRRRDSGTDKWGMVRCNMEPTGATVKESGEEEQPSITDGIPGFSDLGYPYDVLHKCRKDLRNVEGENSHALNDSCLAMYIDENSSPEEQIKELRDLNVALIAEIEALRTANDMLMEQLKNSHETVNYAEEEKQEVEIVKQYDNKVILKQSERISFLEQQVTLMRGKRICPSLSMDALSPLETFAEVFIGQMIAGAAAPKFNTAYYLDQSTFSTDATMGQQYADSLPLLFCTIDFLVHESVTTDIVTGYNSFFDTTCCYKIKLDSLFLYYLCTRGLKVRLHRCVDKGKTFKDTSTEEGGQGANEVAENNAYVTIAEGVASLLEMIDNEESLRQPRPEIRKHIPLYLLNSNQDSQNIVANVEFSVALRTPFPFPFVEQCREQICKRELHDPIRTAHLKSLNAHADARYLCDKYSSMTSIIDSIKEVIIDVKRLDINYDYTPHSKEKGEDHYGTEKGNKNEPLSENELPLLSLYYIVPHLIDGENASVINCSALTGRDNNGGGKIQVTEGVHIPPPFSTPHYHYNYENKDNTKREGSNAPHVTRIEIATTEKLALALQEPLPLFAFDDREEMYRISVTAKVSKQGKEDSDTSESITSATGSPVQYWGVAVVPWLEELEKACQRQVRESAENFQNNNNNNGFPCFPITAMANVDMLSRDGVKVASVVINITIDGVMSINSPTLQCRPEKNLPIKTDHFSFPSRTSGGGGDTHQDSSDVLSQDLGDFSYKWEVHTLHPPSSQVPLTRSLGAGKGLEENVAKRRLKVNKPSLEYVPSTRDRNRSQETNTRVPATDAAQYRFSAEDGTRRHNVASKGIQSRGGAETNNRTSESDSFFKYENSPRTRAALVNKLRRGSGPWGVDLFPGRIQLVPEEISSGNATSWTSNSSVTVTPGGVYSGVEMNASPR